MLIIAKTVSQLIFQKHCLKKKIKMVHPFPYLFLVLLFLLHLCLQFPHHHLPLPLRNGSALLIMGGHQGLYIHQAGLTRLTRGTVAIHHNRQMIIALWCAHLPGRSAKSRRICGCRWESGIRCLFCRLDCIGLRLWLPLRLGLRLGLSLGFRLGLRWRRWTFFLKRETSVGLDL